MEINWTSNLLQTQIYFANLSLEKQKNNFVNAVEKIWKIDEEIETKWIEANTNYRQYDRTLAKNDYIVTTWLSNTWNYSPENITKTTNNIQKKTTGILSN